jgi:glutathione synthase/RimK-type ligase-like ATP-grasp enzyme
LRAEQAGSEWLARPAATHGGMGVQRLAPGQPWDAAAASDARQDWYLTRFVETRDGQGRYRKYRVVFIDGRPYPYHLAISAHWLVHYFSAEMTERSWKQAEERGFLSDPEAVLGQRAWRALAEAGRRLDLHYAGIDFGLDADGRVVVFEANATMLVHREPAASALAYRNPQVERMRAAFDAMRARHTPQA